VLILKRIERRFDFMQEALEQPAIREQEGLAPYPALVIISASADLDPTIAAPAEGIGGAVMIITTAGKSTDDLEPLRAPSITVLEAGAALPRAELVPAASPPAR
jgi:riboflavin biosynthesis pyrimidine reductase